MLNLPILTLVIASALKFYPLSDRLVLFISVSYTHLDVYKRQGDESYFYCRSYEYLEEVIQDYTGMPYVLPAHQGRSAEGPLYECLVNPGDKVPSNTHFTTTSAWTFMRGAEPVDFVDTAYFDPADTTSSVSYTHLDVYKRQTTYCSSKDIRFYQSDYFNKILFRKDAHFIIIV